MADVPCRIVVDNDTTDGVWYWNGVQRPINIPSGSGIGTLLANAFSVPRVDLTTNQFNGLQTFLAAHNDAESILNFEALDL